MRRNSILIVTTFAAFVLFSTWQTPAQFPIKIPKIPKVEKPKTEQPKTDGSRTADAPSTTPSASTRSDSTGPKSTIPYGPLLPDARPLIVKDSIYIQALSHKEYWKLPGQKQSSWVPTVRFNVFYNFEKSLPWVADYYHPDGSLWYSETLKQGGNWGADLTVPFNSDSSSEMLDTKSSIATGVHGMKVSDKVTGEVVFQGKFKVAKFLPPYGGKNEFEYYVDHDWVMPMGSISYHFSEFNGVSDLGGFKPIIGMWFKQDLDSKAHGLEARLFFKGQQIAVTPEAAGWASKNSYGYGQRASALGHFSKELHHWQLWEFQWPNIIVDNGGSYNPDNYPNAFLIDKNPGEYTVKIFQKGVQVREAKFSVGPDGRVIDGGYYKPGYLTYHKVIIPVTVIGAAEKWNPTAWKTEAFYGNPMIGFTVP